MKIGYARVSTKYQSFDLQIDALAKEGCEKIYKDIASGAKQERPELDKMLEQLRRGDVVIIYRLDRLGRSLIHLVNLSSYFLKRGIEVKSISDCIDTGTATGKLMFNLMSSLAEFERVLITERVTAGLEAARARGRFGGRPKGLSKESERKAHLAEKLYLEKEMTIKEIIDLLGISNKTLYNYLHRRNVKIG